MPTAGDEPPTTRERAGYQTMLRALGGWLDGQSVASFAVVETVDGFSIVVEPPIGDMSWTEFTRDYLSNMGRQMAQGRAPAVLSTPVETSEDASQPPLAYRGYADLLRAVGFELDRAEAHYILLSRVADEYLLTYNYVDATKGYSWQKRTVMLNRDGIAKIMEIARSRRRTLPQPKRGWRDPFKKR